ncbi:MAG: ROK family protein [Sphingomonas fennica]
MAEPRLAGLELGGTKCFALLAEGTRLIERVSVPTTTPEETLGRLDDLLGGWWAQAPFVAIGIGSFGPIGLDPARGDHGFITTTPKPGWANVEVLGRYERLFGVPVGFDTDVTGAALAEYLWGPAAGTTSNIYLTIGTGIGGGAVVNGTPLRGLLHPEMGHVRIRRRAGDGFAGVCPSHGDCLEGLASGPAIAVRAGAKAETIGEDHPVWDDVAAEIAELVAMLVLTLSPQRIAFGGGVPVGQPWLLPRIRARAADILAGYVAPVDAAALETIVAPAAFGADAGPLGAIALADHARTGNVTPLSPPGG